MDSVAAEGRLTESSGRTSRSSAGRSSANPDLGSPAGLGRVCGGDLPFGCKLCRTADYQFGDTHRILQEVALKLLPFPGMFGVDMWA